MGTQHIETVSKQAWWARTIIHGYLPDEADSCPVGFPIRLYRICEQEGKTALELFVDAKAAGETHDTLAEKWGVPKNTIRNWSAKYGPNARKG